METATDERNTTRRSKVTLLRCITVMRWIGLSILTIFIVTRALVNHISVGRDLRLFVSAIPSLVDLTGPLKPSDVTVHDLSMNLDPDGLTLYASVSASGPVGDVVLAIEGRQKKTDAVASFHVISMRKSHCYVSLFCE
ncbi:hypothetical protein [Luteibacter aegosomatissinici]|uniref:hypothetical protein n=1 Tax=Luteibacter aegosomatissinici TaxID=2911539 RepID=UPI001FFAFFBD|nr:hypothetical protein [Luteibacter aegosomatissinici]UPG93621.1 hypothetical protein L2Y97_17510 [Luteibacter aegosomatissinici]